MKRHYYDHKRNCTHAISGPDGVKARQQCRKELAARGEWPPKESK